MRDILIRSVARRSEASNVPRTSPWGNSDEIRLVDHERRTIVFLRFDEEILDWAKPSVTKIWWGEGLQDGSFIPARRQMGTDHQLFAVYTSGRFVTFFQHYLKKPPFDSEALRSEKLNRLNVIPGVTLAADSITGRPFIPLALLSEEGRTEALLGVSDWVLERILAV